MRYIAIVVVVSLFVLAGCSSSGSSFEDLPEGDAANGEVIYYETINGAPACISCHTLTDETLVGPGLAGYSTVAATRVEGQSAEEYTYNAIVRPATHLVEGFGNLMYTEYGTKLSEQDIADLMAFLLTQ